MADSAEVIKNGLQRKSILVKIKIDYRVIKFINYAEQQNYLI